MSCSLWLELSPHCNLSCTFCYNPWRKGSSPDAAVGPSPDWFEVVRLLASSEKYEYVALSGGEPLLYRQLPQLVELLRSLGQASIVTTNGRVLTDARLRSLVDAGLSGVQIPLLALDPAIHDELSGGRTSWKYAVRAMLRSRELGLHVGLTFVATARNVAELPRVAALAQALGVRDLVFNEVHLTGAGASAPNLRPPASVCLTAIDDARALAPELRIHVRPSSPAFAAMVPASAPPKAGPWHRLAVSPAGDLKLCNQSELSLGSYQGLSQEDVRALMDQLRSGELEALQASVDNCSCMDERRTSSMTPSGVA